MFELSALIACILVLWFIVNRTFSLILDEKGNYKFVYIPDNTFIDDEVELRKVHISYCKSLQENKDIRFCSTTRDDGLFQVHLINPKYNKYGDVDISKTKEYKKNERLDVCQHCLEDMKKVDTDFENKYGSYNNFQFKKFANDYKDKYPTEFHNYGKKLKRYYYPKNWKKISYNYRQKAGWTCEKCGTYCNDRYNLHVHHKNSIKSQCKSNNLIALCKNCHEKEHQHMEQTQS